MPLLTGKLTITCPKTNNQVEVKKTCIDCKDFKHVSYQGLTPLISCNYGAEKKID